MISIALTVRRCDGLDDWWVIERAEHDGRSWMEHIGPGSMAFRTSARFSDADVEGTSVEMRAMAAAIRERSSYRAKRCAVTFVGEEVRFCSPRNSQEDGVTDVASADALAEQIEKEVS